VHGAFGFLISVGPLQASLKIILLSLILIPSPEGEG
jgi:hypothetical protein